MCLNFGSAANCLVTLGQFLSCPTLISDKTGAQMSVVHLVFHESLISAWALAIALLRQ